MDKKNSVIPGGIVSMGADAADRLIRRGDGTAALLYLYILREGGHLDLTAAAPALGRGISELEKALTALHEDGLIVLDETPQSTGSGENKAAPPAPPSARPLPGDALPEYTVKDVTGRMAADALFSMLVQEVQKALGKVLSSDELIRLYGIYDSLGLPAEVILHLVRYCIQETARRSGPGRLPTMRYIERAAYQWEREGVTDLALAEAFIRRRETLAVGEGEMKDALQIRDRGLTTTEREYIDSWLTMGFGTEAARLAYDRTVTRTGRLTWKYMDSIFKSWHGKGLHTPAEIEAGDRPARPGQGRPPAKEPPRQSSTMADIERMKRYLESGGE